MAKEKKQNEDDSLSALRRNVPRGSDNQSLNMKMKLDKMTEDYNKKINELKNIVLRIKTKKDSSSRNRGKGTKINWL